MTNRGRLFFAGAIMLFVACLFSDQVFAQTDSTAAQLYGRGIHAFNSGQYADAVDLFDQLEIAGTQDPRVFFFRGLSHLRTGDDATATTDFQTASKMELTVSGRYYSIPKALERIQGRERIVIEQHRRAAKRVWEAEQNKRRQEDFLAEKSQNRKLYNAIIESGEAAAATMSQPIEPELNIPFGARPVRPFGETSMGIQQTKLLGVSEGGVTEDNMFLDDLNRPVVLEEPVDTTPAPKKPQDGFDNFKFGDMDDDVEGFDTGSHLEAPAGRTASPFDGFPGIDDSNVTDGDDFGGDFSVGGIGDDEFDGDFSVGGFGGPQAGGISLNFSGGEQAKETGRSFGGAFASLFKKSGDRSSVKQPEPGAVTPDLPPGDDIDDGNVFDDGDDFGDVFDDEL